MRVDKVDLSVHRADSNQQPVAGCACLTCALCSAFFSLPAIHLLALLAHCSPRLFLQLLFLIFFSPFLYFSVHNDLSLHSV